uniref:Uncharacterized protein n=1 Tax=Macrostomum lignano TaxID=282301 RepID=A0A1I8FWS0_9PLAT
MSILLEKQRKDANKTARLNGVLNEHIVIEQRSENATAVDIRLYIRLTARVLPYPDAPRSTASQRYVVRRIDFLCASIPLSNCSVLASIAAQFSSYQKMKELVRVPRRPTS